MKIPEFLFITCVVIISISSSIYVAKSSKSSSTIGFTTDLLHRDSPQSPYYDPSLSPSQRLSNLIRRSYNRLHSLNSKILKRSPTAEISYNDFEYLISYQIGTPPVPSLGILDTGSVLLWTQCTPCNKCIKQRLPLFNPKKSQTYKAIPCNSSLCNPLFYRFCDKSRRTCSFLIDYADDSGTIGELATDTLMLGSTTGKALSIPNFTFGCGYNNYGDSYSGVESGLVGLGHGDVSLVSQLGPSIQGKFAYCLVSNTLTKNTSKLHFGDNAIVSGKEVVSTPLVIKEPISLYYAILEGISVGNRRIKISRRNFTGAVKEGMTMVVDIGATFTMLYEDIYSKVEKALVNLVKLKRDSKPEDDMKLCWFAKTDDGFPTITMHFKGADVVLSTENSFYRVSSNKICFAILPRESSIYGNIQQMNFLVGYDLQKKTISFKRKDCTKY